ncbi:MAG: polyketide synthase dehydratase domain-containing protein [Planctomycetaceae bacterium]|jgi:3-hydroxyacyl-[acyl-carrier-protein] dehydratase|nr:polyketide synthase dehydratase domain-containing protein [Phycisphaerales bacterium]MCE2653356.1 polyketide synthase dehydratase domain-containing protein [Planctomycetaceae bacterium]
MHFNLVDAILEHSAERIVTIKQVSSAEEYLQDHFPGFPVLPGVMMIESMVHAARTLLGDQGMRQRMVLGGVRALKYGRFVRPGERMRVEVTLGKRLEDGSVEFKGEATVQAAGAPAADPDAVAVSGRFTLRPARVS